MVRLYNAELVKKYLSISIILRIQLVTSCDEINEIDRSNDTYWCLCVIMLSGSDSILIFQCRLAWGG